MQVRLLLENLQDMAEADFLEALEAAAEYSGLEPEEMRELNSMLGPGSGPSFSVSAGQANTDASSPLNNLAAAKQRQSAEERLAALGRTLPPAFRARLEQLRALRQTVAEFARKQKALRVYEFLLAAAGGDLGAMRSLMAQGVRPSSTDYDRRNALMVAAHEGQDAAVRLLLSNHAPLNTKDAHGNTAL